ncbi:MAG: hypothetical protein ACO1SX_14340 [Actinomycetota bacterium]
MTTSDYRVEPGIAIGKVALGEQRSRVYALLGPPQASFMRADGLREDTWRSAPGPKTRHFQHRLTVIFKDNLAVQVEATSPSFKTPGGLSTAVSYERLVKALPNLWVTQYDFNGQEGLELYYDDAARGLAFFSVANDEVLPESQPDSLIVHRRGTPVLPTAGARRVHPPDQDKTGAPFPYTRKQTLNKTEAQIVEMGRDKWVEFFTRGDRETATNMSEAQTIFGLALERRNRVRAAQLSKPRRTHLEILRNWTYAFETNVIEMLATLSGGGDTYRAARAGVNADVEELIGRLTGDPGPVPAARTTGDVIRRMTEIEGKIRATKEARLVPAGETYSVEYGLERAKLAREAFLRLAKELENTPRAESDLVLGACVDRLEGRLSVY